MANGGPGRTPGWPANGAGEDEPEPDDGIDRSRMRGGFTTGSAAAAAAMAAALLLRDGVAPAMVALPIPAGVTLHLPLASYEWVDWPAGCGGAVVTRGSAPSAPTPAGKPAGDPGRGRAPGALPGCRGPRGAELRGVAKATGGVPAKPQASRGAERGPCEEEASSKFGASFPLTGAPTERSSVGWSRPPQMMTARASVVKDGGDDPDCTHGAEIVSEVRLVRPAAGSHASMSPGSVRFRAGPGVGTITKPGLELAPGEPAINPVPRQMIAAALKAVLGDDLGGLAAEVTVSVPGGEARAEKTLNTRLGILGGLSILGTSGLVRPYSTAAFRASIEQAVDIARAQGVEQVVFTTGGRSEKFAMARFPMLPEEAFVQMGDFVGFAVDCARDAGMREATLCGMVGKTAKLAQGKLMTHAAGSEVDTRFLASLAEAAGAPLSLVEAVAAANTARHVSELVDGAGLAGFYERLCARAAEVASAHVKGALRITVVLTDFDGHELARASRA